MLKQSTIPAELIPHSGDMCLIDTVYGWDDDQIYCHTQTHLNETNPLRREGRLACVHGIEYAAQAAALHGALLARRSGMKLPAGYLAAVHNISFEISSLDTLMTPLDIMAKRLVVLDNSFIYGFELCAGGRPVISGRLSVIIGTGIADSTP